MYGGLKEWRIWLQTCQLTKQWLRRKELVSGGDNSLKKGSTAEVTKQGWGVNWRQNGMAFRSAWGSWAQLGMSGSADHPIAMIRSVGTRGSINRVPFLEDFYHQIVIVQIILTKIITILMLKS